MTTLKEFKEIEAKATKGPWRLGDRSDTVVAEDENGTHSGEINVDYYGLPLVCESVIAQENRQFITISRTALPALIAVAEGMAEQLKDIELCLSQGDAGGARRIGRQALAAYEAWCKQIEGGDDG